MLLLICGQAAEYPQRNLCLAGGVALNCVANGKILRDGKFDQFWVQPAAGAWFRFNDYAAVVLFALALPGIFEATKNNRVSNWLGDLTYPLYITHDMTMSALFGLWGLVDAPGLAFVNFANPFRPPYTPAVVLLALLPIA